MFVRLHFPCHRSLSHAVDTVDAICQDFGLFRIHTMDHVLVVASNVHEPQPDHAARVCLFTLRARRAVTKKLVVPGQPEHGTWKFMCGIATSSVVRSLLDF